MRSTLFNRSWIVAGTCLVVVAVARAAITVFPVATTSEEEGFPTVCGDVVVWQYYNSRYDDWDILGGDFADPAAPVLFTVSDAPNDDVFPMIDGNDVLWQHQYRPNSDWDVYGADVTDRQSISRYAVSASEDDERFPSVSGGVAVWQHQFIGAPDWDIVGARLTGQDNPLPIYVSIGIDIQERYPCISGNFVVWHQSSPEAPQPFVWGADISDPNHPRTFYTTMLLGEQEMPGLSDGWIVGRATDDVGKVMVDNLFDPFNPEGISSSGQTACPRIHEHIVVWQDHSNGTSDIRGYNLVTGQEFTITDLKTSDQVNPAVHVDTARQRAVVVWQDGRNGNWDIYAAILDGPEVATQPQP